MYLAVWKDSPVQLDGVTSGTEVARPRVTSAPSAPRHWEAPHAAPTAACEFYDWNPTLKAMPETVLFFAFAFPSVALLFPSRLPGLYTHVPPVLPIFPTEGN